MPKQPWNTCVTFCALTIPNDQTLITLEHSAWSLHAILLLIGMAPKGENNRKVGIVVYLLGMIAGTCMQA
jgi:hypothetical protein